MKYEIVFERKMKKDILRIKKADKQSFIKLKKLLAELQEHPYTGTGNPERLKYEFSGFWSRRINKKDRLLYRVDDVQIIVYIVSILGHYSDK